MLHLLTRPDAAAKLDRYSNRLYDVRQHRTVTRFASLKRAVEIDNVNHLRTRSRKTLRHVNGVLIVDRDVGLAPLRQPHAASVLQINCRDYLHLWKVSQNPTNNVGGTF